MGVADEIAAVATALEREGFDSLGRQLASTHDVERNSAEFYMMLRCNVARVLTESSISAETRVMASAAYEVLSKALG